jgi:hypothetical protein
MLIAIDCCLVDHFSKKTCRQPVRCMRYRQHAVAANTGFQKNKLVDENNTLPRTVTGNKKKGI